MSDLTPGTRLRLVRLMDPTGSVDQTLEEGDEGTVVSTDPGGVVHVQWDNGTWLGLLPGVDLWDVLNEEEANDGN